MTGSVLFVTIGMGRSDNLEGSLYTPIGKSLKDGTWSRAILLPSPDSIVHANVLRDRHRDIAAEIHPLPSAGMENDPDRCFDFFDAVIERCLQDGYALPRMVADITRGTKAMSAALSMAAFRHGIPRLRYVAGARSAEHQGTVIPGSEEIHTLHTTNAILRRRLDTARALFRQGNFAAVATLLDAEPIIGLTPGQQSHLEGIRALAAFHGAWDRLDYGTAAEHAGAASRAQLPDDWHELGLEASQDAIAWVERLATDSKKMGDGKQESGLRRDDRAAMARHVARLAADLLANARRRTRQAQYEDASLRIYRASELIGQASLFDAGYDSEFMPLEDADEHIAAFKKRLEKQKSWNVKQTKYGYSFPRDKSARFLKDTGHFLGEPLTALLKEQAIEDRNRSLLIHGFSATGPREAATLSSLIDQLYGILASGFPEEARAGEIATAHMPPTHGATAKTG